MTDGTLLLRMDLLELKKPTSLLDNPSQCPNGVRTMGEEADGSCNQSPMQDLINKVDELIHALRR